MQWMLGMKEKIFGDTVDLTANEKHPPSFF